MYVRDVRRNSRLVLDPKGNETHLKNVINRHRDKIPEVSTKGRELVPLGVSFDREIAYSVEVWKQRSNLGVAVMFLPGRNLVHLHNSGST